MNLLLGADFIIPGLMEVSAEQSPVTTDEAPSVFLDEARLLPRFKRKFPAEPGERETEYYIYARRQFECLFSTEQIAIMKELAVNPFDLVFRDAVPLSVSYSQYYSDVAAKAHLYSLYCATFIRDCLRAEKLYICRLSKNGEYYSLSMPSLIQVSVDDSGKRGFFARRVNRRIARSLKNLYTTRDDKQLMRGALSEIRLKITQRRIEAMKKERLFIARFNVETIYQPQPLCGGVFDPAQFSKIMASDRLNRYLDMRNPDVRHGIGALCAYSGGATLEQLFTVGDIFTPDARGNEDLMKKAAGKVILELLLSDNREEIAASVAELGESMLTLPLPPLCIDDSAVTGDNYTVYFGLGVIGTAVSSIIDHGLLDTGIKANTEHFADIVMTAERLSKYLIVIAFLEKMLCKMDAARVEQSPAYAAVRELEKALDAGNHPTAGTLTFDPNEFSLDVIDEDFLPL